MSAAVAVALPMQVHAAPHAQGAPPAERGPRSAGRLSLVAQPTSPVVGVPVVVRVQGKAPEGVDHRWDVTGAGMYRVDTGSVAQIALRFRAPGTHVVGVRLGSKSPGRILRLTITVKARTPASKAPAGKAEGSSGPTRRATHRAHAQPEPRLAGDPGVTIVDFQFNPATTTIHVGDTITWTNNGPSPHTATANDHSFDTGTLQKGQSASHTFTQPGTFAYICTIHPFMHGTITVLASGPSTGSGGGNTGGGSTGGTSSSSSSAGTPGGTTAAGTAASGSSQTLPLTGFNLLAAAVSGLALMAGGALLRAWLRRGQRTAGPDKPTV